MADYKETNKGFEQQKSGYKIIVEDPEFQELREKYQVPAGCPTCGRLMTNWDHKPFFAFGVCSNCEIEWVRDRKLDPELVRNRDRLRSHILEKIEEKAKNK